MAYGNGNGYAPPAKQYDAVDNAAAMHQPGYVPPAPRPKVSSIRLDQAQKDVLSARKTLVRECSIRLFDRDQVDAAARVLVACLDSERAIRVDLEKKVEQGEN